MAVLTTNQVRQLYVATSCVESNSSFASATAGAIQVKKVDGEMYFVYKNLKTGEVSKSDRIQLKNLDYVKAVKASDMAVSLRKIEITLADNPISGKDYVLGINFKNFYGPGEQHQYYKDAAVHATANMTKSDFYKKMVDALNLSFAREVGATKTSNPYLAFSWKPNGTTATTADAIVIEEKEQPWHLGIEEQERVNFEVLPGTVFNGTDDVIWAAEDVSTGKYYTEVTSNLTSVGNGKKIADMEWFYMGERGDQYRLMGYPNYIPTEYCVDPTKEYSVLELHYAFTDTGVNSYRSEKDITIVVPDSTVEGEVYDVINDIIDAVETATGLTIGNLS